MIGGVLARWLRVMVAGVVGVIGMLAGGIAQGGDWPQFRGPSGLSYADEKGLMTTWGGKEEENIRWKTPLAKADNPFSSPIVAGGRVLLTSVINKPLTQTVLCFDRSDGKL